MKSKIYPLLIKTLTFSAALLLLYAGAVLAEGTKQFRTDSSYYGCMQINDLGRPFALESNTDTLHRLYFHINNYTTEKAYIGFNHKKIGTETGTYRIMNPNGTVAKTRASIPTSGTGFIRYYANAVAGPKISTLPSNGYTPIIFTPTMNGDFYIEFTTTATEKYLFNLFDLTIATSTSNRINGRLWSYCWDLNTESYSNRYWGKFYSYTDDGYVTEFNMNGIQPYGFTVACNNTGPGNTGINDDNRKSIDGNSTRPQYKIFLNDPDIVCYPSGTTPVIMENLALVDTPYVGQSAKFTVKMSKSGTIEMIIELNGTPGYQPNSEDIILVQTVNANEKDTIYWDGRDGLGNIVDSDHLVASSADFYCGVTHFPLYDPETNEYGYIVNRIRPVAGPCKIYWDDSNFPDGTTNVEGQYGPAHTWPYFFGDVRTMSEWWDGYRIDTMATFAWNFKKDPMPIELLSFNAISNEKSVDLKWSTASEVNNDYFTVENSENGVDFSALGFVEGAGNSNSILNYNYTDENPYVLNYYRLKQTDYDGAFSYSQIIKVSLKESSDEAIIIAAANGNINVMTNNIKSGQLHVKIYSMNGTLVYNNSANVEDGSNTINVKPDIEGNSIYLVSVSLNDKQPVNAKVYMN